MQAEVNSIISVTAVIQAYNRLKGVVNNTPLQLNANLSEHYQANIFLKREDLQIVRSYKLRGAYNKISSLSEEELKRGVVCASAGNHAQGVAYACQKMNIKGTIFMPTPTPDQKTKQVNLFGKKNVEIRLVGDTFDDAYAESRKFEKETQAVFIHPFEDEEVIAGQGTVGLEILEEIPEYPDYVFIPIGGGGLAAGLGSYIKQISPKTKIIGVEPEGAAAMKTSFEKGENTTLDRIDKFVDGAAVKRAGDLNYMICREILDDIILIPEGKVCSLILKLYNEEAIVVEPAGALSIAALDLYADKIKGKNVVSVVSGGNNDITRMEEIKERSLLYEALKHYFIIRFPQRAGALKEFVVNVLGPNDDITYFEYSKKNNREKGPAMVGIQLKDPKDYEGLIQRMQQYNIAYEAVNNRQSLFNFLV